MEIFDEVHESVGAERTSIKLKYEPREAQEKMLDAFQGAVRDNKKFVLIDSPVGTGKSFGAMMMMDWFRRSYDPAATFDVLTNSKLLQEQYTRDFDFINSLWGREGYRCEKYQCACSTGQKIGAAASDPCDTCPYVDAKKSFFGGEVSLTNFHLFTTYMLYAQPYWDKVRGSRVLIIDEAHEFDNVYCDFITTTASKRAFKRLGMSDDEVSRLVASTNRCHDIQEYRRTAEQVIMPALTAFKVEVKRTVDKMDAESSGPMLEKLEAVQQALAKWTIFCTEYDSKPDNWVLERQEIEVQKGTKEVEAVATPVWAYPYLPALWDRYDFVVMMSGTLLDKTLFCWMNGIPADDATYLSIPSPFPAANRPIYYLPVGKMNFKSKQETFRSQAPWLKKIMSKHASDKGIIHTVNYELSTWIVNELQDSRFLAHESANRQETLDTHCDTSRPTVLVSPSMINGVDLKDDLSRFQVMVKMPYPNLKSEKVKKRMETNQDWYSWKTVADVIQSYGRSIRSETDSASTYIIDSCFGDILKYSSRYLPTYVREAITHVNV